MRLRRYTVLGLGDTNYTNFCQMGKNFNSRLAELGATSFYPAGFADDGTGYTRTNAKTITFVLF